MRNASTGIIIGLIIISLIIVSCAPNGTSAPNETSTPNRTSTTNGISTQDGTSTALSIVMTTDKTHYAQGETVKLKVTNNLDIPIWYIDYSQRDLVFWRIQRAQENGWEDQDFRLPLIEGNTEVCQLILYERPIGNVMELESHADLLYEWNQKICLFKKVTEPTEPEMIERGRYRFALSYSLDTVKTENIEAEPWKRLIDLGKINVVYSNEFILE